MTTQTDPQFYPATDRFVSFDGAELGLTVWSAADADPDYIIVGLHGMNDYANAFHMLAPWLAERGVTTYAYDQRGFGRSENRGLWPDQALMQQDLRTAIEVAKQRHPNTPIGVVGISMGGAVAMTVFGSDNPPEGVDRLILSGPGVRGWGALNWLYRSSLWLSAHVRPGWVVRPPKGVKIEPSDNIEMLREMWFDPLTLKDNRIDQVYGVVSLMEAAHKAAPNLSPSVPVLLTYGGKDIVIPQSAMKRTAGTLPAHVRTAYYPAGYHMLLRDLQSEVVFADILAFLHDHSAVLPSGVSDVPLR
ncbi:lysophospholipase [Henriciella sp. AS95]|uniref:alpha/beta hydrolase n=1 Tax=Henriciella sp. AS95 TaxID=3135782 RepID=UPI00317DD182